MTYNSKIYIRSIRIELTCHATFLFFSLCCRFFPEAVPKEGKATMNRNSTRNMLVLIIPTE